MKRSRFTEEQIIGILRQAEAGMRVMDLCRQHGISDATFYKRRAKYGGMDVSDAKRLRRLEEENARLKKMVAEQTLAFPSPRMFCQKLLRPASCREAVQYVQTAYTSSRRRACATLGVNHGTVRRPLHRSGAGCGAAPTLA